MTDVKWVALESAPVWHLSEVLDGASPLCGAKLDGIVKTPLAYQPDGSARCRNCVAMEGIL